ncbi:PilW family protein [Enterovibrio calviensis]|uniref:PilW family protein n=1 Tax=Enterovibrio calviensis TaxID=91359 RepID=UPI000480158A|nr:prepilin-type N-terminal cleavage/methylation domain-containing protein [Enterovibrio calviensis]
MNVYISRGYTLVEMMIGMTVSLVVLASSIALFSVNTSIGSQQLQSDFLDTHLNSLAANMKREISRAGFCYDCTSANPFIIEGGAGGTSSILIDDSATQLEGICIRFAYNHDKRSGAATYGKDDAKGYRLGTDPDGNSVIEIYENWKGLDNWNCSSDSSGGGLSGYWRDMTYERIVIDALSFKKSSFVSVGGSTNTLQSVEVTITASLKADPTMTDTVVFSVSIPNVDG